MKTVYVCNDTVTGIFSAIHDAWKAGKTEIAFYMMIFHEKLDNPFRPVLSFYWERFGRKDFLTDHTNKNFDVYVK